MTTSRKPDASDMGHKGSVADLPKRLDPDRSLKLRRRFIAAIRDRFLDSKAMPILLSGAPARC